MSCANLAETPSSETILNTIMAVVSLRKSLIALGIRK